MLMGAASIVILVILLPFIGFVLFEWHRVLVARRMLHGRLAVLALRAVRPVRPLSRHILVKMRQDMANQDEVDTTERDHNQSSSGPAAPERARLAGKPGMANHTDGFSDWHTADLPERMMDRHTLEARSHRQAEQQEIQQKLENFSRRHVMMQQRKDWMRHNREKQIRAEQTRTAAGLKNH